MPHNQDLRAGRRRGGREHLHPMVPALVARTKALATRLGFDRSCSDDFGRLLHTLAASCTRGRAGEIGTGCGVGAAWILSAITPAVRLATVDRDPGRAAHVRNLFFDYPNVRVVEGAWRELAAEGPFTLLFVDVGEAKRSPADVLPMVEPGGLVVMDDMTPRCRWPHGWRGRPDPVREAWFGRTDVTATEVTLGPDGREAAILAVRLP